MINSGRTKTLAEIVEEIENETSRPEQIKLLSAQRNNVALRTMLAYTYGPWKCRLSKSDLKRLLKEKYNAPYAPDYGMTMSQLYQEHRKFKYFFEGTTALKPGKLEKLFVQIREILHPNEFDLFVKMLKKENLAKGFTEKLVRESIPSVLPKEQK